MRFAFAPLTFALCMPVWTLQAAPSPVEPHRPARAAAEQFAGALIDHTITFAGHEFFLQFSVLWRDQPLNERYTLSVHEQPSPRRGTRIWIEYDGARVFQATLPGSRARLAELVREANQLCYQNVVDAEVRKLMFREPDFAPDEI